MQVSYTVTNRRSKIVEINCGVNTCKFVLKKKRAFDVLIKLLELYPKPLDIHKHLKQYADPNRAYNDLKNDEGYQSFLTEARNTKNTMTVKLQVEKLCKHCNPNGEPVYLGVADQRETLAPEDQKKIVDNFGGLCNITKIKLYDKGEFDHRTFAKSLMVVNYDHRRPKFKGGNNSLENYQIISEFVNREKNKICKICHDAKCESCALAYPEKTSIIHPTGQNIKAIQQQTVGVDT